jgi:hypothetical protein
VDAVAIAFLAISAALTVACWIALWRGGDRLVSKIAWTFISAFPLLGPLLYAGMHDPPPVQDAVDRAREIPLENVGAPPLDTPHDLK